MAELQERKLSNGDVGNTKKDGDAQSQNGSVNLKREVGLIGGTALIVGSMVGSGIFVSPKGILRKTDSVGMSLVMWIMCALLSMCGK